MCESRRLLGGGSRGGISTYILQGDVVPLHPLPVSSAPGPAYPGKENLVPCYWPSSPLDRINLAFSIVLFIAPAMSDGKFEMNCSIVFVFSDKNVPVFLTRSDLFAKSEDTDPMKKFAITDVDTYNNFLIVNKPLFFEFSD